MSILMIGAIAFGAAIIVAVTMVAMMTWSGFRDKKIDSTIVTVSPMESLHPTLVRLIQEWFEGPDEFGILAVGEAVERIKEGGEFFLEIWSDFPSRGGTITDRWTVSHDGNEWGARPPGGGYNILVERGRTATSEGMAAIIMRKVGVNYPRVLWEEE